MNIPACVAKFFEGPSPREGCTTIAYMTELIYLNDGDAEVTKVGHIRQDDDPNNPYKRKGLVPLEALHLTQLTSFLKGMLFAIGSEELEFDLIQFVKREVERRSTGSKLYLPTALEINKFA